ncbi:hypothetical protein RJ640_005850 [Escallonia rubra]|uniref:Uncharacterized protein n=1 Tax=Escallonia rubra TaxID=112253 RepID=A0AA88QXQ9_9ASTE|nr:hypothetical protein RJ640_005850 [Escallonia rubra]
MSTDDASKRPPSHSSGGVPHRARNWPFSPYVVAVGGLLIVAAIGYFALYRRDKDKPLYEKKPQIHLDGPHPETFMAGRPRPGTPVLFLVSGPYSGTHVLFLVAGPHCETFMVIKPRPRTSALFLVCGPCSGISTLFWDFYLVLSRQTSPRDFMVVELHPGTLDLFLVSGHRSKTLMLPLSISFTPNPNPTPPQDFVPSINNNDANHATIYALIRNESYYCLVLTPAFFLVAGPHPETFMVVGPSLGTPVLSLVSGPCSGTPVFSAKSCRNFQWTLTRNGRCTDKMVDTRLFCP